MININQKVLHQTRLMAMDEKIADWDFQHICLRDAFDGIIFSNASHKIFITYDVYKKRSVFEQFFDLITGRVFSWRRNVTHVVDDAVQLIYQRD